MPRWCCLFCVLVLLSTTTAPAVGQKQDSALALTNAEMTHKGDLFIGPAKMTLRYVSDEKQLKKDVIVLFITKDRIIYREKEGERAKTKTSNDSSFVSLVQEVPKASKDREWVKKDRKIDGPLVPPETIDLNPKTLTKEQQTGYLVELAEMLHTELNAALANKNKQTIEDLLSRSVQLQGYANKAELGKQVEALFDLKTYAATQEKLYNQRKEEIESIKELKIEEAKMRNFAQAMFNLRQAEATIESLANGADYLNSDDPADLARTFSAMGKFGQAAAQRRIDQQQIDAATKVVEKKIFQKIADINVEIHQNEGKLRERLKSVWSELKLEETILKNLDRLASDLLNDKEKDVSAALEVLDARLRYTNERGLPSPHLISMRNNVEAVSLLKRDPPSLADRFSRADKIGQLGQNTIQAVKMIPHGSLFDLDRVSLIISGASLIRLAAAYAREPFIPISEPTMWDVRADYGARVLKIALSFSTVLDRGGHARINRGVLLLQRGLPVDALAQVETDAKLWEKQPAYMFQLARIECQNNAPKQAAEFFQTALKSGFQASRDLSTDKDLQAIWAMKPQPQFLIDRDKPTLVAYLSLNPTTVKDNFPSYDLKIVNQSSYPLVDVAVRCDIVFTQNFKKGNVSSKPIKISYIGPAGSSREEHFIPDAVQFAGVVSDSILRLELAPKTPKAKPPLFSFPILKGNNTFYNPWRWWWY